MMRGVAREAGRAMLESMSPSPAAMVLVAAAAYLAMKGLKSDR